MRVEFLDPGEASDGDLRALCDVSAAAATHDRLHPSLAPPPAHHLLALRHGPAYQQRRIWVATMPAGDAGPVAGYAEVTWNDRTDNRDHAGVEICVHPDARRRGVATALLRRAVTDAVETFGARLVDIEAPTEGPAAAFLRRAGFEPRLVDRRNVCDRSALDPSLLQRWVDAAAERAGDVAAVSWDGPSPPSLLDEVASLHQVMNSAPVDDLEYDDEEHTPRRLEEEWRAWEAQDTRLWTTAARHEPTGALVGFTVVRLPGQWPGHVEQEDTGVVPAFRRRGIGRWLKALSALRLLAERPDASYVATWNAASNGPMNRLNQAMGFECVATWAEWQADARTLAAGEAGLAS